MLLQQMKSKSMTLTVTFILKITILDFVAARGIYLVPFYGVKYRCIRKKYDLEPRRILIDSDIYFCHW